MVAGFFASASSFFLSRLIFDGAVDGLLVSAAGDIEELGAGPIPAIHGVS